jgi:hypothetical protein
MNEKQQRIAIAEACGWTFINQVDKLPHGLPPDGRKDRYTSPLPDYCNDLNAMHEAEKVLTEEQLYDYGNELDRVTLPKTRMKMCYVHGPEAGMYPDLFRATAADRAEAFLRTIGKWEDVKGTLV